MKPLDITWAELESWLERTPVIAALHPLAPLALDPSTQIYVDGQAFLKALDERRTQPLGKICILDSSIPRLGERLPYFRVSELPSTAILNQNLPHGLDYVRSNILTNHQVAAVIQKKVAAIRPDIVVLFLIDGLSYEDIGDWHIGDCIPCFVDGPSVTYRFQNDNKSDLNSEVGFAALVGQPTVWSRLQSLGYHFAQGYTYWSPGSNKIADYLFTGIPYQRISNFDGILRLLDTTELQSGTYLQIVREGLDGLAHSKRELQRVEIDGAITAVKYDLERLANAISQSGHNYVIFAVADHGILWKSETDWVKLHNHPSSHSRYTMAVPPASMSDYFVQITRGTDSYHLCRYPYIVGSIPADDSGLHGGLSYQESFVPLLTLHG